MDTTDAIITLTGVALVLMAFFVELEHKIIWKRYNHNYKHHKNQFADWLLKPRRWVYWLNIFVIWPLVLILGLIILFRSSY